jgi:hypothetical protein
MNTYEQQKGIGSKQFLSRLKFLSRAPSHSGNGVQQLQVFLKREHLLLNLFVQSFNFICQKVDGNKLDRGKEKV